MHTKHMLTWHQICSFDCFVLVGTSFNTIHIEMTVCHEVSKSRINTESIFISIKFRNDDIDSNGNDFAFNKTSSIAILFVTYTDR